MVSSSVRPADAAIGPTPPPAPRRPRSPAPPLRTYPPLPSRQDFGPHNEWRAHHQPLAYAWEERALPWLVHTCQRAKASAKEGSQRAGVALQEWRAEPPRPRPAFAWCASHIHRVGLAPLQWLQPFAPEQHGPGATGLSHPRSTSKDGWRRVESQLGDDDWLLPD